MSKEEVVKRGRGRPRKQNPAVKEVCRAPVIELTSSSEDDEPPPPPVARKVPHILAKRQVVPKKTISPVSTKEKNKNISDTEALLSILESNDEDEIEGLPTVKNVKKVNDNTEKQSENDQLMISIEDELRYLDEVVERPSPVKGQVANAFKNRPGLTVIKQGATGDTVVSDIPSNRTAKRNDSTTKTASDVTSERKKLLSSLGPDVVASRVKEKKVSFGPNVLNKEDARWKDIDIKVTRINDSKKTMEKTKIMSPSEIKLPPEVLEAIKQRSNLGRIEKIVEKTDSNQKSKYIVIFNRGPPNSNPKKRGTVDDEIEALLKSLPPNPSPKKPKLDQKKEFPAKNKMTKIQNDSLDKSKGNKSTNDKWKSNVFERKPAFDMVDTSNTPKKSPTAKEERVRFTESPLGHEPPTPWDGNKGDGFDKYFTVIERLIEHHDSFDSDSEYEEPLMFSHFKDLDKEKRLKGKQRENDQISVTNIAGTISREFPGWNAEPLPGTDYICLVRLGLDQRGLMSVKKQIKIDSEYNVSVVINNAIVPEYEGMYDSFDSIKQLVHEIDQL